MKDQHLAELGRPVILSLIAAITANQEQIEWWLRCGASLVALLAGGLAIYRFFVPKRRRRDYDG